jgi:DNA polymerase (family 10)
VAANAEIAEVFEGMAALLEKKGDLIFKIRAYRRAAEAIKYLPFQLQEHVAQGGRLRDIPGIGEAIDKKVREYISTGRVEAYEKLKAELREAV